MKIRMMRHKVRNTCYQSCLTFDKGPHQPVPPDIESYRERRTGVGRSHCSEREREREREKERERVRQREREIVCVCVCV